MNERWLQLSLRAYPRRFRPTKTDEVRGATAEAVAAGDHEFVDARSLIHLVLAGWMVRWREHPPIGVWLRYLFGRGRLDPRWHAWMLDDLDGWTVERSGWARVSALICWTAAVSAASRQPIPTSVVVIWACAPLVAGRLPYFRRQRRSKVLLANGFDPATRHWLAPAARPWLLPRPPRHVRASVVLYPMGVAFSVALGVYALWWWVPALRFEGGPNAAVSRAVGQPIAIAGQMATVISAGLAVALAPRALRLEDRLRPEPTAARGTRAELVVNTFVALAAVLVPLLPVTPLVVPLVMPPVLATGPMLLLLGRRARDRKSVV